MLHHLRQLDKGRLSLVLILGLSVILRFKELTFRGYWNDELFSAHVSNPAHPLSEVLVRTAQDVHPPAYQTLLWCTYQLFGYHEITGRMLSALAGVLCVLGVYLLGKEIFGRRVGLYASLIASMNVFLIEYSQETRSYALLGALSAFSLLFFLRLLLASRIRDLFGYIVATGLAIQTHRFGLILAASQVTCLLVHLVLISRDRKRLLIYAGCTALVLGITLIPQLGFLVDDATGKGGWIPPPRIQHFVPYVTHYVQNVWLLWIFTALIALAIIRLVTSRQEPAAREKAVVLLSCTLLCYVIAIVISNTLVPVLSVKNSIIAIPPFIVLAAIGLDWLRWDIARRAILVVIVSLSAIPLFFQPTSAETGKSGHYYTQHESGWRQAARLMHARAPLAPAFGGTATGEKLNVYLQWQDTGIEVKKVADLGRFMRTEKEPREIWLVGRLIKERRAPAIESIINRYSLVEIDRVYHRTMESILMRTPSTRAGD
jgi:mannosyltransferase